MKSILLKLSIIFLPIAIIIVVINYNVDPANVFSGDDYVQKIADIIASGNNAENILNCDERLLQKKYVQKLVEKNPDVVLIGSSRIMEIGHNVFPDKKILNVGVSHADINDLIAIAGLMNECKIKPKEVIINADPFLICKSDIGATEWVTLKDYHKEFLVQNCKNIIVEKEVFEEKENNFKKYYTLFAFDYFQKSLEFIFKGNNKSVINVGKKSPQKNGRYADGSIAYSYTYQHPDTLIVANVAKGMSKLIIPEVDNIKLSYLKCLIDYFQKNKVSVTLIMLPFHQSFYNNTNANQKNVFNTYETFFNDLAKQKSIKIIGSFNAKKLGLNNIDFYDAYHCNGNSIKRIFENYTNK
jgi:hypothetical protein